MLKLTETQYQKLATELGVSVNALKVAYRRGWQEAELLRYFTHAYDALWQLGRIVYQRDGQTVVYTEIKEQVQRLYDKYPDANWPPPDDMESSII